MYPGAGQSVIADLNGDGVPDVAAAGVGSDGGMSVILGKGDGTFASRRDYATQAWVGRLTATDLNQDGNIDLLTGSVAGSDVMIWLGKGDGTFAFAGAQSSNGGVYALAVGDLTGDGWPDIVAGQRWFVGQGGGSFLPRGLYGADFPTALAIGDLDGDGVPDFVTDNIVFMNSGGGFLHAQPMVSWPQGSSEIVIRDLDGDGRADLAMSDCVHANGGDGTINVGVGEGDGSFRFDRWYYHGRCYSKLIAEDVNGDGKVDLMTRATGVWLGNGDHTFQPELASSSALNQTLVGVADFDGDREPDLAVVGRDWNVRVLPGNGDGTFGVHRGYSVGTNPRDMTLTDVDGDGDLDLVVVADEPATSVLLNRGNGTFSAAPDGVLGAANLFGREVAHDLGGGAPLLATSQGSKLQVDMNGDGRLDLVNYEASERLVTVILVAADGSYGAPIETLVDDDVAAARIADMNSDGAKDIVFQSGVGLEVLLGRGDGTFACIDRYPDLVTGSLGFQVGDVNRDGKLDVVTSDKDSGTAVFYLRR